MSEPTGPSNEALQLTKREYLAGRPAPRASVIESRFAAERRCWADVGQPCGVGACFLRR